MNSFILKIICRITITRYVCFLDSAVRIVQQDNFLNVSNLSFDEGFCSENSTTRELSSCC